MKKILITGGSGFIGTNLIEKLLENKDCNILSIDIAAPKKYTHNTLWKGIDIRDKVTLFQTVSDFNPEIVIHLAARTDLSGKNLYEYDSNTDGVRNLIESLNNLKHIGRAIFASSMYVCEPGYIPENFEDYKPHTIYGESKVLTEKIIKATKMNFTWAIIRPTSIWGPWFGEPYANFFDIVLSGKYFHMGAKACSKTYGYVDNTVFQILRLMNVPPEKITKRIFYLGDSPAYNISEWADEIAEHIGKKIFTIPFGIFRIAAYGGDILKLFGINFPMTSFRLKNMTTDNIHDLSPINDIAPLLPISRKEGIRTTIDWLKKVKESKRTLGKELLNAEKK